MNVLVNIHAYSVVLVSLNVLVHAQLFSLLCTGVLSCTSDEISVLLRKNTKVACAHTNSCAFLRLGRGGSSLAVLVLRGVAWKGPAYFGNSEVRVRNSQGIPFE